MTDLKVCFVVNVPEPQRSGIKAVFIPWRRRGDYRTVQLCVTSYHHIKSAIASKKPGLLLHRVISAFHLVLAGTDIARTGHAAEGKTAACCYAVLFRFIVVAVLLATHPQVATNIRHHFIAADLRAIQNGITTTGHRYRATAIKRGLSP